MHTYYLHKVKRTSPQVCIRIYSYNKLPNNKHNEFKKNIFNDEKILHFNEILNNNNTYNITYTPSLFIF